MATKGKWKKSGVVSIVQSKAGMIDRTNLSREEFIFNLINVFSYASREAKVKREEARRISMDAALTLANSRDNYSVHAKHVLTTRTPQSPAINNEVA